MRFICHRYLAKKQIFFTLKKKFNTLNRIFDSDAANFPKIIEATETTSKITSSKLRTFRHKRVIYTKSFLLKPVSKHKG